MKLRITYSLIFISLFAMVIGCYSEKRAIRQVEKAHIQYPSSVAHYCADVYPAVDATFDSIIYMPGYPTIVNDTLYVHDTFAKQTPQYIKQYQTRVDTVYRLKSVQLVNRSKEAYLTDVNTRTLMDLTKVRKERQILYWVAAILAIYTFGRWIVRFWGIKLP